MFNIKSQPVLQLLHHFRLHRHFPGDVKWVGGIEWHIKMVTVIKINRHLKVCGQMLCRVFEAHVLPLPGQ
ncbi:hypothetical protein ES703_69616 [subsurface metagenome]